MPLLAALRQRPFLTDSLLAVAIGTFAIIAGLTATNEGTVDGSLRPETLLDWSLLLVPATAVAFRRAAPVPALLAGTVGTMIVWLNDFADYSLAAGILLYSAVVYGPDPLGRQAAIAATVGLTSFTVLGATVGEAPLYAVPIVALFAVTATSLGVNVATRADYVAEVERRAELAERNQSISEEALLQGERNRIARELHDVVAHGLGVIVVQAGAGRRILGRDPEGAGEALQKIEEIGRSSLTEMRQVLGVLRTEPEERRRPTPGIDSFHELVDDYRASGLGVTFDEVGDRPDLPSTVDTASYRIVQEALTNALKHGGPDVEVLVQIAHDPEQLTLRVLDNGRGGSAAPGRGHGLRGMQERVDVFGGALRAGPRPGGGFEVIASLPVRAARAL